VTPELVFSIANTVAFGSWVALALFPRRRWAVDALTRVAVPALFATAYTAIVATQLAGSTGGFSSLAGVAALFSSPWLLLAGWIHYLAFDLLVGSWEVRDAQRRGIRHLIVLPCLALTFLFGPAGWLSYVAVRACFAHPVAGGCARQGEPITINDPPWPPRSADDAR
jgi:hypothetical protein